MRPEAAKQQNVVHIGFCLLPPSHNHSALLENNVSSDPKWPLAQWENHAFRYTVLRHEAYENIVCFQPFNKRIKQSVIVLFMKYSNRYVCIYVCMYIYLYIYMCVYLYISEMLTTGNA